MNDYLIEYRFVKKQFASVMCYAVVNSDSVLHAADRFREFSAGLFEMKITGIDLMP